jgi:hypothetical protein
MRWAEHEAGMREKRAMYGILVRKPAEMRPLERPRGGWWIALRLILEI